MSFFLSKVFGNQSYTRSQTRVEGVRGPSPHKDFKY